MIKLTKRQLKKKIEGLQYYLGPKVSYNSDRIPRHPILRWLMEYLTLLKEDYYSRKRKKSTKKSQKDINFK